MKRPSRVAGTEKPWFHQGDYFRKRNDAATPGDSHAEALRKAWARFEERVRRSLHMDPPRSALLAEFSDIAETIIKRLLPEDEDDRRDVVEEDYQLQSAIETFEQLTGKVIQPEDSPPILGDEMEIEDIARSV
jgi:hypothetical protein